MRHSLPLRLIALALSTAGPLSAQTVRGMVLDATSGAPVAEATVSATTADGHSGGRVRTGADGHFQLPLRAAGSFRIEAERTGYRTTTTDVIPVAVRETVTVEVRVAAAAVALDPLRVTGRVTPPHRRSLETTGFYDRERAGFGRFIRREDFEHLGNLTAAQVLLRERGTVRGYGRTGEYVLFARARRGCPPALYLDGTKISSSVDLNEVVTPGQIEAVELYRSSAEVPVQWNGSDAACGVILIWTRKEP